MEQRIPTIGRIVQFFPNIEDAKLMNQFADNPLPAIVTSGGDMAPCLNVLTRSEITPSVVKLSVTHKEAAVSGESYWDWPEVK